MATLWGPLESSRGPVWSYLLLLSNKMSVIPGPSSLLSASGAYVDVASVAFRTIAFVFADPTIPACSEAIRGLLDAFSSTDAVAVCATVVSQRDADIEALFEAFQDHPAAGGHLFAIPAEYLRSNLSKLKAAVGLGAALLLPEIVLLDARTGSPVSTDAAALLKRLGARAFGEFFRKRGFRSNCFVTQERQSDKDNAAYSAMVHPDTLATAGFYPGDAVLMRPLGRVPFGFKVSDAPAGRADESSDAADSRESAAAVGSASSVAPQNTVTGGAPDAATKASASGMSLCIYVNPPLHPADAPADDDSGVEDPEDEEARLRAALDLHVVALAPSVLANLRVCPGSTVSIELLPEPPAAAEGVLFSSTAGGEEAETALRRLLGVDSALAETQARALLAATTALRAGRTEDELLDVLEGFTEGDAGEGMHLSAAELRRATADALQAQCCYVPVVAGQVLVVSSGGRDWQFRVERTVPRFAAVVIGPETRVVFQAPGVRT